jgi:hypothetical protein
MTQPVVTNNDVIRAVWIGSIANQVSMNRMYFLVTNVLGSPTVNDCLTAIDNATGVPFPGMLTAAAVYHGVSAQLLRKRVLPATGFQLFEAVFSTVFTGPGTRGADPMAIQTRGIIRWTTLRAARGLNCRFYAPFPATTDILVSAVPTALYLSALGNFANAVLPPLVFGSGVNTGNLQAGNFDTTNGYKDGFTGFTTHNKFATQRRSGNYGRPNTAPF